MLLASLVVYGHSWYLGGFGQDPISHHLLNGATNLATLGVQGFFMLSGYLVLQSERRSPSTRAFLVNRGLRIYPGLWLCLLLTGLLLPAVAWWGHESGAHDWHGALDYFWRNLALPRTQINVPGLFLDVPKAGDLNGSLWTLPYELGCYAVLGAAGWIGLTRSQSLQPWLIGAAILGLYWFDVTFPAHAWFFKTEGRRLAAWFVCGALLALVPEQRLRSRLHGTWALFAALGFILSCHSGGMAQFGPVAMAIILLWLAWHLPGRNFEQLVRGDYSYGLYIYAYPVQQALAHLTLPRFGATVYFFVSLLLTLPLAVMSWHLVERHALRLKLRASRSPR